MTVGPMCDPIGPLDCQTTERAMTIEMADANGMTRPMCCHTDGL
jgi:hypothetical protein